MAILRTIVWFLYFFVSLVCLLPAMYRAKHLKKIGDDAGCRKMLDHYVPMWMSSLMKIAGCKVNVKGLENIPKDRAVVFVCNHQGDYDVPITMVHLGASVPAMVAKIETRKIPMVRTWMELLDCIFIDRQDPRQAITAMKEAGKVLEAGRNIVVFPEGTRSRGDHMNEFKTGVFKIPFNAGAPIVPGKLQDSGGQPQFDDPRCCESDGSADDRDSPAGPGRKEGASRKDCKDDCRDQRQLLSQHKKSQCRKTALGFFVSENGRNWGVAAVCEKAGYQERPIQTTIQHNLDQCAP